jgi:hypothetical protein
MKQINLDNIYRDIMLLSDFDKNRLYERMKAEIFQNSEIVAYTTSGKPLTKKEYIEQVNMGLRYIENGEMISDEVLEKEIELW